MVILTRGCIVSLQIMCVELSIECTDKALTKQGEWLGLYECSLWLLIIRDSLYKVRVIIYGRLNGSTSVGCQINVFVKINVFNTFNKINL